MADEVCEVARNDEKQYFHRWAVVGVVRTFHRMTTADVSERAVCVAVADEEPEPAGMLAEVHG